MQQRQTHKCHSIYYHPTSQPHCLCKQKHHSLRDISLRNMHAKIHFMQGGKADIERKRLPEKANIGHSTQVKFWFKFKHPQYSIRITGQVLV